MKENTFSEEDLKKQLERVEAIERFIGEKVVYDPLGQYIWGVDKEGGHQKIADLRGWGAIQNLFRKKNGKNEVIDLRAAEKFQDGLGEWIAHAINQKLENGRK